LSTNFSNKIGLLNLSSRKDAALSSLRHLFRRSGGSFACGSPPLKYLPFLYDSEGLKLRIVTNNGQLMPMMPQCMRGPRIWPTILKQLPRSEGISCGWKRLTQVYLLLFDSRAFWG